MLEEGGRTKNGKLKTWYLWGFSNNKGSSYFEIHNTRSGDVASDLLKESSCEYLVSDVFSGYNKAVRETNVFRKAQGKIEIKNVYCNAHAYRKFKDLEDEDFSDICDLYKKIYRLERIVQRRPTKDRQLKVRVRMKPLFEEIKSLCLERMMEYSSKSDHSRAMKYFMKNYAALVLFIQHPEVPIDNNAQERQMRNPVIGRKIWYGNHSLMGARTSAILFSIVESCKLAGVNPRKYLKNLVQSKLLGQPI
ncbi:MAG: IS66 family transposase, partial [bacterium]|nr:IS66 family transposase [bacterium]